VADKNGRLNAAVIGVGIMGNNHARVYARLEDVNLVAVADVNSEVADQVAGTYKARAYTDYREMLAREQPDVVSIVVPTRLHRQVALDVIAAGAHCLVEKPLAATMDDGEAIIQASEDRGTRLTVGHIERFNPAVLALKEHLAHGEIGRIFQILARRVGPFPSRVEDVGVVFDLATHEVNIMEYLVNSPVDSLYAETEREIHARHEDLLSGLLKFHSGSVGVLDINWLTPTKIRELYIIGERGMFFLNYLTQSLRFYENPMANGIVEGGLVALMGISPGKITEYDIRREEPLKLELQSFVEAIRQGNRPAISAEEGLRAVYLAQKLVESGQQHQIILLDGNWRRPH
jgi:predicted dehydrogenase